MRWKAEIPLERFHVRQSIETDAPVESVYALWIHYEDFPHLTESVRHTKCVGEHRVVWDIDIKGRQVVWEAQIVEAVAQELVRWESRWGARNSGTVRFERFPGDRTRLTVEIEYERQGFVEHLGSRCGVVDHCAQSDLDRIRNFAENLPADEISG
jgi:uncharacterized membrane protein